MMHSYGNKSARDKVMGQVLILVLMDDALVLHYS